MTDQKPLLVHSDTPQAVVIGAGIAGLLAARVLSDYYTQVLIIERDTFPETIEPRAGTPQAFHVHRLLPRGKMILEQLFPGYIDDLIAAGAYETLNKPARIVNPIGIFRTFQPEKDVSCSRALLEWEVRQRVQAVPNIRFLSNQEVTGLQIAPEGKKITGVSLRERGQLDQSTIVSADLVIDASGRTSKLTQWLQELGYILPENEQIKSLIGYSTRYYKASSEVMESVGTIVVDEVQAEGKYGVGALPIENDTLWVTLFGIGGHYPSTDADGFERDLAHLNQIHSQLADELQKAEPLTPPRGYRVPVCIRHHYELAERWPEGLLVLGDAFCHFDPIYGQGMTVAAIEAETLAAALQEQRSNPQADFERKTLQRMQEAIAPAWWLSAISDLRGTGVTYEGPGKPQGASLIHRYLDLYFKYSLEHPAEPSQAFSSPLPNIVKFFLLNGLILPPVAIFNAPTFGLLLEEEAALEGPQILHELVQEYHLSPAEILEKILPSFSSTSQGL